MARLLHEIWEEDSPAGKLPTLCLAGPDGAFVRNNLKNAKLVQTFEAGSNHEAMTLFYAWNGWGEYKLSVGSDQDPYPESWLERQRGTVRDIGPADRFDSTFGASPKGGGG